LLQPTFANTLVTIPFSTERLSHRVGTGFADGDQAITQDIGGGQILSATRHDRSYVPHRMSKGPSAPGNAKRGRGACTGAGCLSTILDPRGNAHFLKDGVAFAVHSFSAWWVNVP